MLLLNYLGLVLKAQGQRLILLSEWMGEDALLKRIERCQNPEPPKVRTTLFKGFGSIPNTAGTDNPYLILNEGVAELSLSTSIEDVLWNYPYYRSFSESDLSLLSKTEPTIAHLKTLAEDAIHDADLWIENLKLGHSQAVKTAEVPWLIFRSIVLHWKDH